MISHQLRKSLSSSCTHFSPGPTHFSAGPSRFSGGFSPINGWMSRIHSFSCVSALRLFSTKNDPKYSQAAIEEAKRMAREYMKKNSISSSEAQQERGQRIPEGIIEVKTIDDLKNHTAKGSVLLFCYAQ